MLAENECRLDLDPGEFVAFVPADARTQFSYGSEHASHGVAAAALISARTALERSASILNGPWDRYLRWIDERLSRLWKLQGPAPGLGGVLSALHAGFNGTLFAMALADELEENSDPSPAVNAILSGSRKPPPGSPTSPQCCASAGSAFKAQPRQLDFLKLLARLELSVEQARRALPANANSVLANPYVLFENDRTSLDPISFGTVDRGLYPGKEVASAIRCPWLAIPSWPNTTTRSGCAPPA